ncbi:MAG: type II toxin-antitoxin system Phd/YefM family antitoxin [Anaerolineae bacterium]
MDPLNTAEVKARLSELINRVAFRGERLIVLRRGKAVAALIGIEDLRRLEKLDADETHNEGGNAHPIMRAFGGWAGRTDIDELLAEIYADREVATGRDVTL